MSPRSNDLPTRLPRSAILLLAMSLLAGTAGAAAPPAADRTEPMPDPLKGLGEPNRLGAQLPLDLPFVDSQRGPLTLGAMFDGALPVILTMNYSNCPRLCSLQLNGLFAGLEKLEYAMGDKYRMITVSLDPQESPQRAEATRTKYLTAYDRPGAGEGYRGLVGQEAHIRALADAAGFAYAEVPNTNPKQYAHAAVTIICTPDGKVSRYLTGIEYNPTTLRLALLEAAEGKIGSATDQILLFCFAYDAQAGSYSLQAIRIMQAGGILTVMILGAVLSVLWMREKQRTRHSRATALHDSRAFEAGQLRNASEIDSQSAPTIPDSPDPSSPSARS